MTKLNVNGRDQKVDAEDTPLLYVLRDDLQMNGAKFVCGLGQCGACILVIDKQAVFSCITRVLVAAGKAAETIEGLGRRASARMRSSTRRRKSSILLTLDPVRLIDEAAHKLLSDVGQGLSLFAVATERHDASAAGQACSCAYEKSINLLEVRIGSTHSILRWSTCGRLRMIIRNAKAVAPLYEGRAILLHASALVPADMLSANLEVGLQPPRDIAPQIAELAATCLGLGSGGAAQDMGLAGDGIPADWRPGLDSLNGLERIVRAMRDGENRLRSAEQGEAP
jgi:hypothetical protein